MAATPGTVERRTVHLSGRAALTIVGTIVGLEIARRTFVAAHRPLSWAAACVVAAVLLDPVVDRLAVHIRRVPAVLLSFLAIGAVTVGTTYLVFDGLQQAVSNLQEAAPEAADRIEARSDRVGELATDFHLTRRVTSFTDALGDRVTGGDDVLRTTAGTAPTYLVCAILTVFLMTYGPRIASAALAQDPDEARRAHIAEILGPAVARARSSILLTAALATTVGLATAAAAAILDLPAPTAVGLTAGVLAILPHVGILVGAVPLLLLALGLRSTTTALVLATAVVALQVLDSAFVRGWIGRHSVDIGLLVPCVVALLGYEVYGIGGAAYGLAYAVAGLAVLDQFELRDRARPARAGGSDPSGDAPTRKRPATAKKAAAKVGAKKVGAKKAAPARAGTTAKKAAKRA